MSKHPEELLPWYVNGTLAAEERARVEEHLAGCAHCRAEVELLKAVRGEVRTLDAAEGPGELARARMLREARAARRMPSRWLPLALAASLAVVAVQTAMLLSTRTPQEGYTPLGAAPAGQAVLQVRFAPEATEREIRAALEAVDGSIVDGPSALGVYRVRLDDLRAEQHARIAAALETLRAAPVVTHVEREP